MKTTPASNMDVKRRNRANTLRCILSCERISQMELSQRLALSWPTILQNVKELVELGLVQEVGQYESTGGRKAKAYAPVRETRLAIGLDLTGNHVSVVLVDLSGQVVRYQRKSRPFSLDGAYLQGLGELVQSVMGDAPAGEAILGVGISLPGIVDSEAGLLRYSHILDLRDVPLDMLGRHIPYPCGFLNDANAAGFAEIYGASTAGNLVYLSLSNSVGGAILADGSPHMGNHLRAGEFGHNTLVPGGRRCYCGKQGCADAYLSPQALERDGWEVYLEHLAVFITNLRMLLNLDLVIGGQVGIKIRPRMEVLTAKAAQYDRFARDVNYIFPCIQQEYACALGAAGLAMEQLGADLLRRAKTL